MSCLGAHQISHVFTRAFNIFSREVRGHEAAELDPLGLHAWRKWSDKAALDSTERPWERDALCVAIPRCLLNTIYHYDIMFSHMHQQMHQLVLWISAIIPFDEFTCRLHVWGISVRIVVARCIYCSYAVINLMQCLSFWSWVMSSRCLLPKGHCWKGSS